MTEQEEFEFRLRLESEQAAPVQPTAPSSEGYLAEAARQGFAGTVGALTGAANVMRASLKANWWSVDSQKPNGSICCPTWGTRTKPSCFRGISCWS